MNEQKPSNALSPDSARYGSRLQGYLRALAPLVDTLTRSPTGTNRFDGESSFFLPQVLPALRQAFNSKIAFIADSTGVVRFTDPQHAPLSNLTLQNTEYTRNLLEKGSPLILFPEHEPIADLASLGVESLLAVRLATPQSHWFIGVCDGSNEPEPYLAEDMRFLDAIAKMTTTALFRGDETARLQEEKQFASERYFWARLRGEWRYLARASEDYATTALRLPRGDGSFHHSFDEILEDELLADYLDAELCHAMRTLSATSTNEQNSVWRVLLNRCQLHEVEPTPYLQISLSDNKADTPALECASHPRTTLAMARVFLCAGYLKAGARVSLPIEPPVDHVYKLASNPANADAADLFWTVPKLLLESTELDRRYRIDPYQLELQIDWARTIWQRMHYIASVGIVEPLEDWLTQIDRDYTVVWDLSAQILFHYLTSHPDPEELCLDSDWLIMWLASNVLLSKRLAEYYHLANAPGKSMPAFSPMAKMRYILYLSQHVLYCLHCVRQSIRKDGFQDEDAKYAAQVRRPPFADVPMGFVPNLSEAQLYILSEYAYREIGVHWELRIFERLSRQLYHELPLYAGGDFYRDHLYHVVDVCLLGELLLRSLQPAASSDQPESLTEYAARCAKVSPSGQLLQNWYVAALCHDLGYIIEQVGNVLKPAGEINGEGLDDLLEKTKQGLDQGKESLRHTIEEALAATDPSGPKYPADELKKAEPTDHGIVAWLHLSHWLRQIDPSKTSLAHALQAVLRHNLPDQEVTICDEPLSVLLILCDHLQEWGRPRVGRDPLARAVIEAMRFSEQAEFEQKIRVRQLFIRGLKPVKAH